MKKTEKKVPELRFKGFVDDWEQRQLRKLADFNPNADLPGFFEYVDLESVVGTDMISHRTESKATAPSRAQRLAQKGDVFYQTVRPYQKNNYLFDLPYDNYVFSTGYAQLRPKGDSYFLLSKLQEERFVSDVLNRSTGTSYPAINSNDLADIEVMVTLNIDEQRQIGNFFKQLDNTITLHQRKLEQLKRIKQAFLQQLFPAKEENVPKVRFANFEEVWELCKVMDMSEETYGGGTPRTDNKKYWQGEFPWIQSSDLKSEQFFNVIPTKFITNEAINESATKSIPSNSIAVVTRVGVGKLALIPYDYTTSQDFLSLSSLTVKPWFGVYSLYKLLQKEINNIQGTSIKGMTKSNLLEMKMYSPMSLEEQTKIGTFFKQLDNIITLHERKLEQLQSLKKAYLQKLFA